MHPEVDCRLSRGTSGRFKDSDLAKVIQEATHDVAGAYKARGIPAAMKAIEVMGIIRSRQWGVCSVCILSTHWFVLD